MRKKLVFFLKIAVGIIILALLLYKVGIGRILNTASSMNLWFWIPLLIVYIISFIFSIINFSILFRALGYKIPFSRMARYYLLSWTFALITPGRLGDFSLAAFTKNEKVPVGEGTAVVVMDRIITLVVVLLFGLLGFFIFFSGTDRLGLIIISVALIAGIIFAVFSEKVRSVIRKLILRKYADKFRGFSKSLIMIVKTRKKFLALNLLVTLLKYFFLNGVIILLFFMSFGYNVSMIYVLPISAVAMLIGLIPVTINGLGIKTSVVVFLYLQLGIPTAVAASVDLIDTAFRYVLGLILLNTVQVKK